MNRLLLSITALTAISATATVAPAQVIAPTIFASIHDEPVDGLGDLFNGSPFEGLIRTQSTRADRAIQEYDVSALTGQSITSATISGRVAVNNAFDNGVRTFDFLLYNGNGSADLTDYQITATVIGTGSYHPPINSDFTFQFDVTTTVQALLTGGATFVGLKVVGTSNPNFPNILVTGDCHLDIVPGSPSIVAFCSPGVAGVMSCPCSNPPSGSNRGCDNSAATGGASVTASGTANLASDTLVLQTANQTPSGTTIVLQGTVNNGTGLQFGQGVRCVAGTLKRLYVKSPGGSGGVTAPAGSDPTISAQSATLGDSIVAGQHRYYMAYYRDPIILGACTGAVTFNSTNALDVTWN